MCMAGFLPFSAIYIELYYIFASVWGHKVYTIYSILFIVFIILIIVTAFITIALTYFQLAVEDHEWWWRSVLCGGSTGKSKTAPFFICICVCACVRMLLLFLFLSRRPFKNSRWSGNYLFTGLFIYGYCFYYYYARSDMTGFMQTSFFFGYMACVCYAFFIMLGTVGWRASLAFVRHIYRAIKAE